MKNWRITGPDFEAELSIDATGTIAAAQPPLEHTIGLAWTDARQIFIDLGWHGDRYPSHIRGKSGLKRRGWKPRQIEQLGEPDDTEPNPHHEFGKPMGIYCIRRVEALEAQWGISAPQQQQQSA